MSHVYLDTQADPPVDIFATADYVTVSGYQVDAQMLDLWTDDDLARLHLARAEVVTPDLDPSTDTLTGEYVALYVDGVWSWVAQTRALTAEEIAALLDAAKALRTGELSRCCAAEIMEGVVNGALGTPHTYPMSGTDQTNLLARVAPAQIDPNGTFTIWCADAAGVWGKRNHTAAQTIAVALSAATWVQANSDRLSGPDGTGGLIGQVQAAATIAEVNAVVW